MAPISLAALALVMMPIIGALPVKPARAVFLGIARSPEKIARTLVGVQDEWKAQVASYASCDSVDHFFVPSDDGGLLLVDCRRAPIAFGKSCETVVQAVTEGSSGDRDVVEEYMKDICGQDVLKGWRQDRCTILANSIVSAMSFKTWAKNGVVLEKKKSKVCTDIWSEFLSDDKVQRDGERKRAAAKVAEDAKSKAGAEAKAEQEAKKRADEELHEAAEEEAEEAAAEAEDAAKEKAEAKAKVEAEEAAKSKAEAEEAAKSKAKAAKALAEARTKANEAGQKTEAKAKAAKAQADAKANADNEAATARANSANLVASRRKAPKPRVNASAKHTANATANPVTSRHNATMRRVSASANHTANATANLVASRHKAPKPRVNVSEKDTAKEKTKEKTKDEANEANKTGPELPEQGYDGPMVRHKDAETVAGDWGAEYPE